MPKKYGLNKSSQPKSRVSKGKKPQTRFNLKKMSYAEANEFASKLNSEQVNRLLNKIRQTRRVGNSHAYEELAQALTGRKFELAYGNKK